MGKIILGVFIALVLFFGGCTALVAGGLSSADSEQDDTVSEIEASQTAKPKSKPSKSASAEPTEPEESEPVFTTAQENAIKAALSYLEYSSFSRSELIGQLEFEDYKTKTAQFAVKAIENANEVDWKKEAVEAAQGYMDYGSWSKAELKDQLLFEGFTEAQAQHGVNVAYK